MTRKEQIEKAAKEWADKEYGDNGTYLYDEAFILGAEWADENPSKDLINSIERQILMSDDELQQKLAIAIEALEYYANHDSVIKEAYHSNDERQITCVHTFINHKAKEALEKIK